MQDQDLDHRILPLREDRLTFIAAREFLGVAGGRPAATGLPTVKRINKQIDEVQLRVTGCNHGRRLQIAPCGLEGTARALFSIPTYRAA